MFYKFKTLIATLIIIFGLLLSGAPRVQAFDPLNSCNGSSAPSCNVCASAPSSTICKDKPDTNPISGPNGVIGKIAVIISYVVGVASIIMLIWGGFRFTKSNGESSKIADAKSTITYALVGVAVTALAATIATFIGTRLL